MDGMWWVEREAYGVFGVCHVFFVHLAVHVRISADDYRDSLPRPLLAIPASALPFDRFLPRGVHPLLTLKLHPTPSRHDLFVSLLAPPFMVTEALALAIPLRPLVSRVLNDPSQGTASSSESSTDLLARMVEELLWRRRTAHCSADLAEECPVSVLLSVLIMRLRVP